MRPGFGDGFDAHRIKSIWKIYKGGPVNARHPQVRAEWWIFWRRVAGGLNPGQQRQFIQDLSPDIFLKKGAKMRLPSQELREIWMAAANMEYLSVKDKIKWGEKLVSLILTEKPSPHLFWSLSRIGARELLYGPVDRVVPPAEIAGWLTEILSRPWADPQPVCAAVSQLSRKTGDRMRDLSAGDANRVVAFLAAHPETESQIRLVTEVVPMERMEQQSVFGESLPSGIVLKGSA